MTRFTAEKQNYRREAVRPCVDLYFVPGTLSKVSANAVVRPSLFSNWL
jgi:hypothetical protein